MPTEHTPGPWEIECEPWLDSRDLHIWSSDGRDNDDGVHVATTSPNDVGVEQRNANARLIAAAPDLMALAKAYEQWEADLILCQEAWNGGEREFPEFTEELWDRLMELQSMRNTVIAKAAGKDSANV